MRVIEEQMLAAIEDYKNWKCRNTEVRIDPVVGGSEVEVYLHGHLIAKRYFFGSDKAYIGEWEICLCRWNTPTTRSRLNAIIGSLAKLGRPGQWPSGAGVSTNRGVITLRDARGETTIDSFDWHKVVVRL
jgi:hypothetical protein